MEILVALDPFYNISKSNYGASVTRKYVRVGRLQHLDMKKRQLSNCKYLLLLLLNVLVVEHEFVEDERNDSKNIKTGYNRLFNQFDCNTGPSNQTVYLTLDMEAYDNCPNFRKHFGTESQSPANNRSNNIEHKHELTGRGILSLSKRRFVCACYQHKI
uniref:Uncharacterized protein n=1 Tax=Glossina austeni TaxID=7395 RepID=A0A1A9VV66_GLOAU